MERRIERQVANLKAEDTTPALRRRIADRIAGLEQALEELRQRATALAREAADAPSTPADLATALERLPLLNDGLSELPQPNLRAVFDSLHFQLAFQPAAQAVDLELTLIADEPPDRDGKIAQVWSVPLMHAYSNPRVQDEIARLHELTRHDALKHGRKGSNGAPPVRSRDPRRHS